jgi:hypothetical protein
MARRFDLGCPRCGCGRHTSLERGIQRCAIDPCGRDGPRYSLGVASRRHWVLGRTVPAVSSGTCRDNYKGCQAHLYVDLHRPWQCLTRLARSRSAPLLACRGPRMRPVARRMAARARATWGGTARRVLATPIGRFATANVCTSSCTGINGSSEPSAITIHVANPPPQPTVPGFAATPPSLQTGQAALHVDQTTRRHATPPAVRVLGSDGRHVEHGLKLKTLACLPSNEDQSRTSISLPCSSCPYHFGRSAIRYCWLSLCSHSSQRPRRHLHPLPRPRRYSTSAVEPCTACRRPFGSNPSLWNLPRLLNSPATMLPTTTAQWILRSP